MLLLVFLNCFWIKLTQCAVLIFSRNTTCLRRFRTRILEPVTVTSNGWPSRNDELPPLEPMQLQRRISQSWYSDRFHPWRNENSRQTRHARQALTAETHNWSHEFSRRHWIWVRLELFRSNLILRSSRSHQSILRPIEDRIRFDPWQNHQLPAQKDL